MLHAHPLLIHASTDLYLQGLLSTPPLPPQHSSSRTYRDNVVMLQVGQLQQRVGRVRDVRHGPTDGGGVGQLRAGDGLRLPREQLRRGAGQAVRVQEATGSHPQDRRQRVPGGRLGRGVSRPLPQLSVPLSQLRLR